MWRSEAVKRCKSVGLSLCIIPVYAPNVWCRSWPGKVTLVCALLLCNKCTEVASNSCVSRSRENVNIDVVYYIYGCTAMVSWRECRN